MEGHKKNIFIVFLSMILVVCATTAYNYYPQVVEMNFPPVEEVSTAYIGESLLSQGRYKEHTSLYTPDTLKVGAYTLSSGYISVSLLGAPWESIRIDTNKN